MTRSIEEIKATTQRVYEQQGYIVLACLNERIVGSVVEDAHYSGSYPNVYKAVIKETATQEDYEIQCKVAGYGDFFIALVTATHLYYYKLLVE